MGKTAVTAIAGGRGEAATDPLNEERMLSERDAAAFLGFGERALQNWRLRGGGPLFVKVSARAVRYRLCDLRRWSAERLRASTSEQPGATSQR